MKAALIDLGQSESSIAHHCDEVSAMADTLEWANEGDLVFHLVHMKRDAVRELLDKHLAGSIKI
jgi:hypothetical protein